MERRSQRRRTQALENQFAAAVEEMTRTRGALDIALGIKEGAPTLRPVQIKEDGKRHQSVACLVCSDWHFEETVEPGTVNGLNEYNLDIARKRIRSIWPNGMKLVTMTRSTTNIDTLVLALLGDHITGYIHDELMEGNGASPTQACLDVYGLIMEGINFLLKEGGFKKLVVVSKWGNHGRTTLKPRVGTAYKNSFEYMVYRLLMLRYANEIKSGKLEWQMSDGYFDLLNIYGWTYRFHHGDNIKYMGGIGGVCVPLLRALAQWNRTQPATVDVLGHWHERQAGQSYVINGSTIGYNAYSIRIKAAFQRPQQSFFLVHPRYGRTIDA